MSKRLSKSGRATWIGAAYSRVSTKSQVEEGDSLPQQINRCEEKCRRLTQDNKGEIFKLRFKLQEEGLSGKNTKRPKYLELLRLIRQEKIDFVVATEISRLNRSLHDFLELGQLCENHNVRLITIVQSIDTADRHSLLSGKLFAVLAEYERELTRQRLMENIESRLISEGRINGAKAILGLDADSKKKGHFKINKMEARRVERIFDTYLRERSLRSTLQVLRKEGIKDKGGKPFDSNRLGRLIKNTRVAGYYELKGERRNEHRKLETFVRLTKDLPHGPVIPKRKFKAVQEILARNLREKRKSGVGQRFYPLQPMLRDEEGNRFRGDSGTGRNGPHHYYLNKKRRWRVDADDLEELVRTRIKGLGDEDYKPFKDALGKLARARKAELPQVRLELRSKEKALKECRNQANKLYGHLENLSGEGRDRLLKLLEDEGARISDETKTLEEEINELKEKEGELSRKLEIDIDRDFRAKIKRLEKLEGVEFQALVEAIFPQIIIGEVVENLREVTGILNPVFWGEGKVSQVGHIGSISKSSGGADGKQSPYL